MKIILMILLLPSFVLANGVTTIDMRVVVSDSLDNAGNMLIYDCKEKHWKCVQGEEFEGCRQKFISDQNERDNEFYSCFPFEALPSKRSCEQKILFYTSNNYGSRFCIKEDLKNKATDF